MMTKLQLIMMAIVAFFIGLFAAPASAAQGKGGKVGFNFLPTLCAVFFAVAVSGNIFAQSPSKLMDGSIILSQALQEKQLREGIGISTYSPYFIIPVCLHISAALGEIEAAKLCIEGGQDVNLRTAEGETPLHAVAQFGNNSKGLAFAKFLIENGARLGQENNYGETPADLAISKHGKNSRIAQFLLKETTTWEKIKGWIFSD